MWNTIQRLVLLGVAGVSLGLLVNALSPRGISYITPTKAALQTKDVISLAEARVIWESGAGLFLDARSPADYAAGHIPLAWNLPLDGFENQYAALAGMIGPQMPLVVYCDGEDCELSHKVQRRLQELGHANARVLVNGWSVWRAAGLPTTTGAQR